MIKRLMMTLVLAALVLAACAPATTVAPAATTAPTKAAEPTKAPAATAVPATKAPEPTKPAATAAPAAGGPAGVLRLPLRPGVTVGWLWAAAGRHLDEAFWSQLAQIKWTADGVQPMLAESWTMEEAGKAFVFKLRKGVKWTDGTPFTADDVVFTFNTAANPKVNSTYKSKLAPVAGYQDFQDGKADNLAGVKKVDELTVRVEMSSPTPLFVDLNQSFISILPNHILSKVAPDKLKGDPYWKNVVGTGPFKMTKLVEDQYVEGVANPDYFLGKPKLDKIVFQVYADTNTMLNALKAGEIDAMLYAGGGIPVDQVPSFQKMTNLKVLGNMDAGLPTWIMINLKKEYFQDIKVRQAMMYAIDRKTILSTVKLGLGTISNAMFPAAWARPKDLTDYGYDPVKAKQLLTEAKWDTSRKVDFQYYYSDQVNKDTVLAIQGMLQTVGINAQARFVDSASFQNSVDDNSLEIAYAANGQGLDPSLGLLVGGCKQRLSVGYCNEKVDAAFAKGAGLAKQEERAPFYQEISKIYNQELPKIWLWYEVRPVAFDTRIVGMAEHFSQQPLLMFDIPVYNEIHTWYTK